MRDNITINNYYFNSELVYTETLVTPSKFRFLTLPEALAHNTGGIAGITYILDCYKGDNWRLIEESRGIFWVDRKHNPKYFK